MFRLYSHRVDKLENGQSKIKEGARFYDSMCSQPFCKDGLEEEGHVD